MKKKVFYITSIITICTIAIGVLLYLNPNYSTVLKTNWGFHMPIKSHCIEIYGNDTGDSFHGDGMRYHIFSYKYEDGIEKMFTWSSVEQETLFSSNYSEAANEWLNEIGVPDEYHPNYSQCVYWYNKQKDSSEIIVMWDSQENKVYIAESFL